MGRAIVRDPQVFLFDEPLSNLDAKLRVQMRTEIKELHQRLKTTSIYVTHDQIEAMTMADKIVVMRDGRDRADRRPARALRPSGQPVRRRLHRLAGDELPARHAARATAAVAARRIRRRHAAAAPPGAARRRRPAGASSACGPSTCAAERRRHRRSKSSWSSRPAPTPSSPAGIDGQEHRRGVPRAPRLRARRHDPPACPTCARAHLFDAASGERLAA